jgi:hypothetical protein
MVSSLAYSLTLKLETACSSKMSVDFQRTTQHYIPEDITLQVLIVLTLYLVSVKVSFRNWQIFVIGALHSAYGILILYRIIISPYNNSFHFLVWGQGLLNWVLHSCEISSQLIWPFLTQGRK